MTVSNNDTLRKINEILNKLWLSKDKVESLLLAIELSNSLMYHFGVSANELPVGENALNNAFPNAKFKNQKMEQWFEKHPFLKYARIALSHYNGVSIPVESNFYQLNESSSKARISATTQLSSNWEDSTLTMLPRYKVGIDFFYDYSRKSLSIVITNQGKLRVLELSEKLSNTQVEILSKVSGCLKFDGKDSTTGLIIPFEPQRTIHRILWSAFELQEVNKKFYNGVSDLFIELYDHLKHHSPSLGQNSNVDNESKLFSSRLIGRLLFLWFLRKKGIIDVSHGYFDIGEYSSTDYYENKLKPLFFSILNTPVCDRRSSDIDTPYLNGGLFEPHDNDWVDSKIVFPNFWFKSLFDHFNRFNFTTDESSPEYEQIAIDPEMLGRVFENLLASIVSDTSATANERNNKGAFYTPREIVSFMNKEALKNYIKACLNNQKDEPGVDKLIDLSDAEFIQQKSTGMIDLWGKRSSEVGVKVIESLNKLKVLDPACGSGAFPIGLMQLLVRTYERLSNDFSDTYKVKLSILKNNLFGSDIEPMAIEISRLRSWLSLIIDDKGNIEPLPNLDFNFVCANSLIPLDDKAYQISIFNDFGQEEKMQKLRGVFFDTHDRALKTRLKDEFAEIYREDLGEHESYKRVKQLKSWNPFDAKTPALFFDPRTMFNVAGFDILIGNPPYNVYQGNRRDEIEEIKQLDYYPSARGGKLNAYKLFLARSSSLLKDNGFMCQIFQNSFLGDLSAKNIRKHFLENYSIRFINSFPERDDTSKRVFPGVKMSTCIMLAQKTKNIDSIFTLNIFSSRDFTLSKSIDFVQNEIFELDNINFTILSIDQTEKAHLVYLSKLSKLKEHGRCYEGEINLTFHKSYLVNNAAANTSVMIKGASVQPFFIASKMSQGEDEFLLVNKYLKDYKGEKTGHHKLQRIVLQGITGVDEKQRLKMAILDKGIFCGNSANYVLFHRPVDLFATIGQLNSSLHNWYFKKFSTNSNVNGYEVDNLPLILDSSARNQIISALAKIMVLLKTKEQKQESELSRRIKLIIDICVLEVYYSEYCSKNDLNLSERIKLGVLENIEKNETVFFESVIQYIEKNWTQISAAINRFVEDEFIRITLR